MLCLVPETARFEFFFFFEVSKYVDFSKLLYRLVKIDTWISLSCYMDLLSLLLGFLKVVLFVSCPICADVLSVHAQTLPLEL